MSGIQNIVLPDFRSHSNMDQPLFDPQNPNYSGFQSPLLYFDPTSNYVQAQFRDFNLDLSCLPVTVFNKALGHLYFKVQTKA